MWQKFFKIFIFALLLCFWSTFLLFQITLPAAEDLPRQMKNGAMVWEHPEVLTKNVYSYTEPDHAFANHHWLYGIFVFWLHAAVGWGGMVLFKFLFLLLTFALLLYVAGRRAIWWVVAVFALPAIFMLSGRLGLRPEIFSYGLVVVFLYFLLDAERNPQHARIYWLIPLQLLWVNTHLLFVSGVLMIGGFLFEQVLISEPRRFSEKFSRDGFNALKNNPLIRKLVVVFAAALIVIFINPFGLEGALYSLRVNTNRDFPIASAELATRASVVKSEPVGLNTPVAIFWSLVLLLVTSFIVALVFRYKRKEFLFKNNFIFYFLASLGTIILSIIIIRGSPLFGLIFLPAISANLSDIFIELKIRFVSTKKELLLFIAIILAMLALLCGPYFANWWRGFKTNGLRIGITKHSESAARFWLDNKLKGPIFNDTDIGSYLIYYLYPEEKVFTDNRFGDAYSGDFFSNIFLPIMADEERWEEAAETYKFNAIFWYQYDRGQNARDFLFRRMNDPGWAVVYADEYALIILKRVPENEDIINKFEITRLNAADRLGDLAGADDFDSQVAAADLFSLMGRTDLAMDQYYKVVSRWPDRGRVWMIIGEILLTSTNENIQNPYLAMLALERALANGWKSTEAYSYLALAYYRTSQIDRARAAVDEELQIDPDSADGQRWLGILAGEPLAPEH